MPRWLDTRGKSTMGIGICGRCSRKFSLDDLYSDPNFPGLKVCRQDLDDYDPYRLPPRPADQISLRFARPDTPLTIPVAAVAATTYYLTLEDGSGSLLLESGDYLLLEDAP